MNQLPSQVQQTPVESKRQTRTEWLGIETEVLVTE